MIIGVLPVATAIQTAVTVAVSSTLIAHAQATTTASVTTTVPAVMTATPKVQPSSTSVAQVAYAQLPSLSLSPRYTMTVNGVNVPVNAYQGNAFGWFAFSGTANVAVTVSASVTAHQLSPKRDAPSTSVAGAVISFSVTTPRYFVLHHVNAFSEDLFIFADALEVSPPLLASAGVFNVQTYGASPSGSGNAATGINQAIDAANAYGVGGVAYVPAGTYNVSTSVVLKSNVHLYLAPGAVIQINSGSYTSGIPCPIQNTVDATISGRGAIYAANSNSSSAQIQTLNNRNLHLRDILLVAAPSTLLRLGYEVDSGTHNLKILAGGPGLADGTDFDGVWNVVVEDCFIWSTDDNFAVGSGADLLAYRRPANTDGLTIRHNVLRHTSSGHSFSMVAHVYWEHARNVLFEDNDSVTVEDALGMYPSSSPVILSGVTVRNNRWEHIRNKFLDYHSTDFFSWGGCPNGFINHQSGSIHKVLIDTNTVDNSPPTTSVMSGRSSTQNIDAIQINRLYLNSVLATSHATANIFIGSFVTNVTYTNVASPAVPVADATVSVTPPTDEECGGSVGTPLADLVPA